MTFRRTAHPRAAKPHVCCECRREIAIGERHELIAGRLEDSDDGGPFMQLRTCLVCADLRREMDDGMQPDDCAVYGELWDAAWTADVACPVRLPK